MSDWMQGVRGSKHIRSEPDTSRLGTRHDNGGFDAKDGPCKRVGDSSSPTVASQWPSDSLSFSHLAPHLLFSFHPSLGRGAGGLRD
jgi:hypothetical protein